MLMFGFLLVLAGVTILGIQTFAFLMHGEWHPFTAMNLIQLAYSNTSGRWPSWVIEPDTWIGVHAVLSWLPASLSLIIVGFVLVIVEGP